MLWGGQVLLVCWRQGAKVPQVKRPGAPLLILGSGGRGASVRVPAVLSSSPLKAVGLWPCSFLPSSLRLETSPPPRLLRKLLSLSPQVIFHHVASKSWALLGEGRGGRGPINPFLPVEGRPRDPFDEQKGSTGSPGVRLSMGMWWPNPLWEEDWELMSTVQWKPPAISCSARGEDRQKPLAKAQQLPAASCCQNGSWMLRRGMH